MTKDSWEAVLGHLGSPEEVAQEWCRMQDELNAYKLKEVVNRVQSYGSPAAHRNAVIAELRPHVGKTCTSCGVGSMYLDTNGYTYFLRCQHCQFVPLMKYSYGTQ